MRWLVALVAFAFASLVTITAGASQVHFQPLERVVRPTTRAFTATVTAVTKSSSPDQMFVDLTVTDKKALRGALPVATALRYSEIIPVMRGADGGVVGYFSPILPASGHEHEVKKGETVIVLTDTPDGAAPLLVFRIEPMSRLAEVNRALAGQADAAAPPPTVTASTASAPAPPPPPSASGPAAQASVASPAKSASAVAPPAHTSHTTAPSGESGRGCSHATTPAPAAPLPFVIAGLALAAARRRRRTSAGCGHERS